MPPDALVNMLACGLNDGGHHVCLPSRWSLSLTSLGPAPQIASPGGRAIFTLRGMPSDALVDVVACGLVEARGTMSVYRDGAFLWCAPPASPCMLGWSAQPACHQAA